MERQCHGYSNVWGAWETKNNMKKEMLLELILKYMAMKFPFDVVGHIHTLSVEKGKFCTWL